MILDYIALFDLLNLLTVGSNGFEIRLATILNKV